MKIPLKFALHPAIAGLPENLLAEYERIWEHDEKTFRVLTWGFLGLVMDFPVSTDLEELAGRGLVKLFDYYMEWFGGIERKYCSLLLLEPTP